MVVFEVRKKLTSAAILGAVLSMSTGLALGQEIKSISGGMGAAATHDTKAAVKFTEIVKEKTDGRIEITHYSGGQLGKGQEQMEAVSIGTQHFFISSGSQASRLVKAFGVMDSAFQFKDFDHLTRSMDSDMGQQLNQQLGDEFGVRVVSASWFGLPRHLMHRDKFISSIEDVVGVRKRASSVPMFEKGKMNKIKMLLSERKLT